MYFRESQIINRETSEVEKNKLENIAEDVINEIHERGFSIGEGKTANVKKLEESNHICVKVVDKNKVRKERTHLSNHVNEELDFLDRLSDSSFLKRIGIAAEKIVPKPFLSNDDSKYGCLFMEYIQGVSLKEIIEEKNKENTPENINWITFFEKLEDIVKKLNAANIYHRDLHSGNIMMDAEQNPILIDFGNAYESLFSEDDPYSEETIRGKLFYHKDTDYIKEIKKEIIK
ncbi:MAG: phosphotransferase [Patescibacteria group bacterium]|nr:phosphotransferase [Patescibacteria group bacterium]